MSAARQIDLIQGSPEWHEWRRGGVGGSDVAALFLGPDGKPISPYKTERDLWFEKSGFGEPDDEDKSYIFEQGHKTEAEVRDKIAEHTKIEIRPTCFQRDEIRRVSLDGHDKSFGVLETKLVGKAVLERAAQGEIPEYHRLQIMHQLGTSDSDKGFWAGRMPKSARIEVVEFGRHEPTIKLINDKIDAFWEKVLSGKMPELSERDILFITDPKQAALFDHLAELKTQKDLLDQQYEEIEKKVKALATHSRVRCGRVTISSVERAGSIDYGKIPEIQMLGQDYVESFRKKSAIYKTIRIKQEA